jgi:hypothetical protein
MNKQLPAVIDEDEIHAVYSPSAAKRWIPCPGSINASKGQPPQKPNFYSAEGSVAHSIAANYLENKHEYLEWYHKDGIAVQVTEKMLDAVMVYVAFVRDQINKYAEQPEIERKVKITDDCFGTADSIIYSPYRILIVNDYKHGAGIQVDAEMNEQMMIYAIGRLLEIPEDETVELPIIQMNIIQPRGAGEAVKTFEMKVVDLLYWYFHTLLPAIQAAKQPDAPLNPGDWCKYCPAALTCPALKKENLAVAKLAFQEPTKWVDVLTPKQIAELLDKESMVMAFYKRLNEHAAELASKNTKIPGYSYEKKWGNRKWKDEKEAFQALKFHFGKDNICTEKLLGIPAIEKLIKERKIAFDLKDLIEKPFTGYALKKANGKEITVKEVFEDVE